MIRIPRFSAPDWTSRRSTTGADEDPLAAFVPETELKAMHRRAH